MKTEVPVYKFSFHSGAEAFKEARLIIEQIAQEYDMGWIPVTEKLPEEDQTDYNCAICTDLVMAWMPRSVPEPYKGS
jgi:hypothetical protein